MTRPAVSVIVPFSGSERDLDRLVDHLLALVRQPDDELIIADNRSGAQPLEMSGQIRVHPASAVASAGFARNRGAAAARSSWLVFIDADTEPAPGLLDAYFRPHPGPNTAMLAGGIEDIAGGGRPSLSARHAVARHQMSQSVTLERRGHAYAQSANLAVRRDAFVQVRGFEEHIRAAEDADLCFRLRSVGFTLESRPEARVRHLARTTLVGALGQLIQHGAGAAWCERRHPGSFPSLRPDQLIRRVGHSLLAAVTSLLAGEPEQTGFAMLEIAETLAFELGRLTPNRPRWRLRP